MAHTHSHAEQSHIEPDNIDLGAIVKFIVVLTVVTVVVHGYVWVLMGRLTDVMAQKDVISYPLALEQGERLPPEPRLQTLPKEDLAKTRERDRARLEGYSWVDKNAGTVRIPIEDAMKRVLGQGIPVRADVAGGAAAPAAEPAAPAPAGGEKK